MKMTTTCIEINDTCYKIRSIIVSNLMHPSIVVREGHSLRFRLFQCKMSSLKKYFTQTYFTVFSSWSTFKSKILCNKTLYAKTKVYQTIQATNIKKKT